MKATVIGAGLAGSEAAWYLANRGVHVTLYESRPHFRSEAHQGDNAAELVCSNSLKSNDHSRPTGLLKEELRRFGSLLMRVAEETRVPAGAALAVDRELFSSAVQSKLEAHRNIDFIRREVTSIPTENAIIATGPLTSPALFKALSDALGQEGYFYDAIAPVVECDSIDFNHAWRGNRWDKGESGDAYVNCPLDRDAYDAFVFALREAKKVTPREFEDPVYFESCLPIEVMAARGLDVLRHGPMRPVGLRDPKSGKTPYAVIQLRSENLYESAFNLVGCQTRMTYKEQDRVFRLIPALAEAVIVRHGEIHRNSYFNAPALLEDGVRIPDLQNVYLAGLLLGVEGYVESIAMGLYAAISLYSRIAEKALPPPPATTCLGGLLGHLTTQNGLYSPTNINFGCWPRIEEKLPKKRRHEALLLRAQRDFEAWFSGLPQEIRSALHG